MSNISSPESDPTSVPPGDAAGEAPRELLPHRADPRARQRRVPPPEEGASPDGRGIHWQEQSELGLSETRADEDAGARERRASPDAPERQAATDGPD